MSDRLSDAWSVITSSGHQKLADLFAASGQIASPAPKFNNWVDRRYNDVLRPLFISTN